MVSYGYLKYKLSDFSEYFTFELITKKIFKIFVSYFRYFSYFFCDTTFILLISLYSLIYLLLILYQFVIFKPLSYRFEETIGFNVKVSFACLPVLRLIRWYNKPGDITKEFWKKAIQFNETFHGLKITNWYERSTNVLTKLDLEG